MLFTSKSADSDTSDAAGGRGSVFDGDLQGNGGGGDCRTVSDFIKGFVGLSPTKVSNRKTRRIKRRKKER